MELYHKTLVPPHSHSQALGVHLVPIKPKQEHDKPRQLLLAATSHLHLYRYMTANHPPHKLQLKQFHSESLFSSICAVDAIAYQDDDLLKDFVIVTLNNGKYQLLEWMTSKNLFTVIDEGLIFSDQKQTQSGLVKPIPGQYIAVNNQTHMVLIASVQWDFVIYQRNFGMKGIRLDPLYNHRHGSEIERLSICLQLAPGQGSSCLFYSLRTQMRNNQKVRTVYTIRKDQFHFDQEAIIIDDPSVHLLVARGSQHNFFLLGNRNIHYTHKGKVFQLKIPHPRTSQFTSWWRRPLREKKEDYFILNEEGQILVVSFDDSANIPCSIHFIQAVAPAYSVAALEKNIFFMLTTTQQYLLIESIGKYRVEERVEKTRSSSKLKDEKEDTSKGHSREFQVVGTMQGGRIIRDMKICNMERSMNNQILLTGSRTNGKKGFLEVIRYGLKLKSLVTVNCTAPVGLWSLKRHSSDKHHSHIVLSYSSRKTVTFLYDSSKLVQTNQLKLDQSQLTMNVTRFFDNSLIQVAPYRMKYISKEGKAREQSIRGRVLKVTSVPDGRQLLLSMVGGFFQYFQVVGGDLKKIKDLPLEAEANHIEFSPPQMVDNKLLSKHIAASFTNYFVKIYSVTKGIELVCSYNVKSSVQSLVFLPMTINQQANCLHIGAHFGRNTRWILHRTSAEPLKVIEDTSGDKTVKFQKIHVLGKPALFRTAPQPQLTYQWQGQSQSCALHVPPIDLYTELSMENSTSSLFVTHYQGYLRIIQVHGFDSLLYTHQKQFDMAGRKIIILEQRIGLLIENRGSLEHKKAWTSRFLFLNPLKDYQTENSIDFQADQKVLSAATLTKDGRSLVCFGCVTGHTNFPHPTSRFPIVRIYGYELNEGKVTVSHLFNCPQENSPTAMDIYFGKLLIGVGNKLVLFDIYKSKLVVRACSDTLSSPISSIHVHGQKIFLAQVMSSFTLMRIDHKTKCFEVVGQDVLDRFTTCTCLLDGQGGLIAGGDKFGGFFASKITQKIRTEFEQIKEAGPFEASSVPNFMESLVNYHLGEVPTAIQKGCVDPNQPQRLFYSTSDGRVGQLCPFEGDEEQELLLLKRLQQQMGKSNFCGASNHRLHRNYFSPSKGVVDGDFCEVFLTLSESEKARLSASLGKQPKEIIKLLTDMQSKFS